MHKISTIQSQKTGPTELEKAINLAGVENNKGNTAVFTRIFKAIKEAGQSRFGKKKAIDFYHQGQVRKLAHKLGKLFKTLGKDHPELDRGTYARMSWSAALHSSAFCKIALDSTKQENQRNLFQAALLGEIECNDKLQPTDEFIDEQQIGTDDGFILNDNILFSDHSIHTRTRSGTLDFSPHEISLEEKIDSEETRKTEYIDDTILISGHVENECSSERASGVQDDRTPVGDQTMTRDQELHLLIGEMQSIDQQSFDAFNEVMGPLRPMPIYIEHQRMLRTRHLAQMNNNDISQEKHESITNIKSDRDNQHGPSSRG